MSIVANPSANVRSAGKAGSDRGAPRGVPLSVLWDADFLLGPRTPEGDDNHLLCEINISGVFPIPDESVPSLVEAAIARARIAREARTQ
jgi:hypothetical protein